MENFLDFTCQCACILGSRRYSLLRLENRLCLFFGCFTLLIFIFLWFNIWTRLFLHLFIFDLLLVAFQIHFLLIFLGFSSINRFSLFFLSHNPIWRCIVAFLRWIARRWWRWWFSGLLFLDDNITPGPWFHGSLHLFLFLVSPRLFRGTATTATRLFFLYLTYWSFSCNDRPRPPLVFTSRRGRWWFPFTVASLDPTLATR